MANILSVYYVLHEQILFLLEVRSFDMILYPIYSMT